jgi:hypothetical protein
MVSITSLTVISIYRWIIVHFEVGHSYTCSVLCLASKQTLWYSYHSGLCSFCRLRETIQYSKNIPEKPIYCSEASLTGESWFHKSTPLGIEPGSLITGSKWVNHWTSSTVYECSEIAGSKQYLFLSVEEYKRI